MDFTAAPAAPMIFPRHSRSRTLVALVLACGAAVLFFHHMPALDIAASRLFFSEVPCPGDKANAIACGYFPASRDEMLGRLRSILQTTPLVIAVSLLILVLARRWLGTSFFTPWMLAASAAVWSYAIAVGLMVNVILKSHSGRPRPAGTLLFGGDMPFIPVGGTGGLCVSNCSFASGEAASAFWLLCLVPLFPPEWRRTAAIAAASNAVLTSGLRLAFGAHFLSDIIVAALLPSIVYALLSLLFDRWFSSAKAG